MRKIGNTLSGEKQKYFFEQLDKCDIIRFTDLATEKNRITIYGVREAETMLQSEFEGYHEPRSIERPTAEEVRQKNAFDERFRQGLLSGDSTTLNEQYTDVDAKVLVSDETLQSQANQRKKYERKNLDKMSMYEQSENLGISMVGQKYKHCNIDKVELPSGPHNVKHIVNTIELTNSETEIAIQGIIDGAKIGWAENLNLPTSSISDETALQGVTIINQDITIKRIED